MVEVLHFTGGEIIPRRVLCPWRAHLLASTLPAVVGTNHCCPPVVRGPSHWRRESAGPPFSRLSRPGEHLTHQPLLAPLRRPKPRPTIHSHLHMGDEGGGGCEEGGGGGGDVAVMERLSATAAREVAAARRAVWAPLLHSRYGGGIRALLHHPLRFAALTIVTVLQSGAAERGTRHPDAPNKR